MKTNELYNIMRESGYNFYSGVPDSTLNSLFTLVQKDEKVIYVPAVREDLAIGLCVGAYLAGTKSVVLMQNSGLGISLTIFASLVKIYKIPLITIIGWRGFDKEDAPEHIIMGKLTIKILKDLGISFKIIEENTYREDIYCLFKHSEINRNPAALVIKSGMVY